MIFIIYLLLPLEIETQSSDEIKLVFEPLKSGITILPHSSDSGQQIVKNVD